MEIDFDAKAFALNAKRRIFLFEEEGQLPDLGTLTKHRLAHTVGHMFKQLRGLFHLALENAGKAGIVEGSFELVVAPRLFCHIDISRERDIEVGTYLTFLWQDAVEAVKAKSVDADLVKHGGLG